VSVSIIKRISTLLLHWTSGNSFWNTDASDIEIWIRNLKLGELYILSTANNIWRTHLRNLKFVEFVNQCLRSIIESYFRLKFLNSYFKRRYGHLIWSANTQQRLRLDFHAAGLWVQLSLPNTFSCLRETRLQKPLSFALFLWKCKIRSLYFRLQGKNSLIS